MHAVSRPFYIPYVRYRWQLVGISCVQVLSIGLQVLKSMVQRGTSSESYNFVLFFSGELLRDFFGIFDKMLKVSFLSDNISLGFKIQCWSLLRSLQCCSWQKPINREAVAIATECLRILAILQTLSKGSESQKDLMNLLLEAIVMVFSSSDDDLSLVVWTFKFHLTFVILFVVSIMLIICINDRNSEI